MIGGTEPNLRCGGCGATFYSAGAADAIGERCSRCEAGTLALSQPPVVPDEYVERGLEACAAWLTERTASQ